MTKKMPENSAPAVKKRRHKFFRLNHSNQGKNKGKGSIFASKKVSLLSLVVFALSSGVVGYVVLKQSHAITYGTLSGYIVDVQSGNPLGAQPIGITDSNGGGGRFITTNPYTVTLESNIYKMYVPGSFRAGGGTWNFRNMLYCRPYPCSNYQPMVNIQDAGNNIMVGYFAVLTNQTTDTRVQYAYTPDPTPPPPPPPPAPLTYPTISSFSANPNPVTAGSTTNINWSSNADHGCTLKSGNVLVYSGPSNGTYRTSALTSSTLYQVTCINSNSSGSVGVSKSLTVNVNQPTATPPSPGSPQPASPPPAAPGQGGSHSGTSSNKSSAAKSKSSTAVIAKDTTPPSVPGTFSAKAENGTVDLQWDASKDNSGTVSYLVERSEDQNNWSELSSTITDTSYTDVTASFNTHYYYRLTAVDPSGNHSGSITTDASTSGFSVNVKVDEEATINSDDGLATAHIQAGTFDEDVSCVLNKDDSIHKIQKGKVFLGGFYQLVCKDETSTQRTIFTKPVEFNIDLKSFAKYKNYSALTLSEDKLSNANAIYNKDKKTLVLTQIR
jgi:hypothetical protein